jgi:hypothetical protein
MKIDYVIVSCDDNELYSDFWEVTKKLWNNIINIKPILVKITDNDTITEYDDCIIHNIKKVDNIDTGLQSQIARMFVTKYYPNNVCLTSDIDMLPLSKSYFTNNVENYDDDKLIIFSSDAYTNTNRYPICYNAAKGELFNEILNLNVTFEQYCNRLIEFNWGWDTDELYFGKMVNQYLNQDKVVKLKRGWVNGMAINRIDRVLWMYNLDQLKQQGYFDSHSLRPYKQYQKEIDFLVSQIL